MVPPLKFSGARVALSATHAERIDITTSGGRILPFDTAVAASIEYDLSGHLLLPGLINSHDHLEFNLFPRLGSGPYPNASAWAADIYHLDRSPIKEQLAVPKRVRLLWGAMKNLLSGVTTVAHHNPYERSVFDRVFPIRVVSRFGWAHSLEFSPDLAARYARTPPHWPFIVHAGEGTDERAHGEIPHLAKLGVLGPHTALVHAVALTEDAIESIRLNNTSIIWCPSSNLFTLGRTLSPCVLRSDLPVSLGTDSAISGAGDLIDELRIAREAVGCEPEELYRMVTTGAARILRLSEGQGMIREGGVADLIAVADDGQTPADALSRLAPELVMVRGRIALLSSRVIRRLGFSSSRRFQPIYLEGRGRSFVAADLTELLDAASRALGSGISLAGKRVVV
jgi:cytosine/adenosine deaminase-related metal-dependent hydrolase